MSISVDKIKSLMHEAGTALSAESLLEANKVEVEYIQNFWKGEATITGSADGYRCQVFIVGDQVSQYRCQCGNYGGAKGLCCHMGALALAYIRNNSKENQKVVYTSPEADSILWKCRKRAVESYQREEDVNDVGLSYDIMLQKDVLAVEFFITAGKYRCRIDNLEMFEEYFTYGVSMSYGTDKISILHNFESFQEEFRPMVAFMLKSIRHQKEINRITAEKAKHGYYAEEGRRLLLVGDAIDEFMELCYESGGVVRYKTGDSYSDEKRGIVLTNNNPDITVRLEAIGTAGFSAEMTGVDYLIKGDRRIYILKDSFIFMADEVYTSGMKEFITETVRAGYNMGTRAYKLVISKKDMPAFCNLVIANIKIYCNVITHNINLDDFRPWELECNFDVYMDDKSYAITCKAQFSYRGQAIDIFNNVNEFKGTCRDYRKEAQVKTVLCKYFRRSVYGNNTYYTSEYRQIFEFIKSGITELEGFGEVNVSKEILDYNIVDSMKINANVSMERGWLKLDIDAGEYSREELQELLEAYGRREKYIRLQENKLVKLDHNGLELLAQMAYDLDFSATDIINHQVFIPKYRALYIDGRLRGGELVAYDRDAAFKSLVRTIKQVEDSEFVIPEELEDILRGYQKHGFHWLRTLDACGFGGILADDMGLGKTLQIISLLLDEKISVSRNVPSLIIAPASLVYSWENEIRRFAPELCSVVVAGTKAKRREILGKHNNYDVFITSYELLKRDIDIYNDISFRFQVIDEAQCIKNYFTENAKCVKKINAQTRFALTGTPIENRLSELWSIFDYLMPGFLYSYNKFKNKFEKPITTNNEIGAIKGLTRMISPFVLRRLKKDVLKELPEKLEYDVYTKLEGKQHKLYLANALKLKKTIEGTTDDQFADKRMQILAELMNLRQLCCDPSLCYHDYDGESSKLQMCIDMVKNGISGGHKILIFSQFTTMLDILGKHLEKEGISYYTLTGATPKEMRINMVDKFNRDDTNVFLISLKAGGVGLNLTGADMVIHYDPWWNVAAENQASDRAHRIGQDKEVSVFKLISKGTVEESIRELQKSKAQLADNILNGETISLGSLSKNELLGILSN